MRLALLATVALVAGCAPQPAWQAAEPETVVVTLERRPCFGRCPVYQVQLFQSGEVRYEGKTFVRHAGPATILLPPDSVKSLVAELRSGGYFELDEQYVADSPGCGRYSTDSPTVVTSATSEGKTKRIQHDYGCSDAPPVLARLERRIDEVAGTAQWTTP